MTNKSEFQERIDVYEAERKRFEELRLKGEAKRILSGDHFPSLDKMFLLQQAYQKLALDKDAPVDSVQDFHYSMSALVCEIGEVLQADKRWKTMRNEEYNKEAKLEELIDCFAFLINACIFSGFSAVDVRNAFWKKVKKNFERSEIKL